MAVGRECWVLRTCDKFGCDCSRRAGQPHLEKSEIFQVTDPHAQVPVQPLDGAKEQRVAVMQS